MLAPCESMVEPMEAKATEIANAARGRLSEERDAGCLVPAVSN